MDDERRFVTIETKLAYQEKTIFDLNEVVIAQGRSIESLERRLAAIEEQLRSRQGPSEVAREKPPHY